MKLGFTLPIAGPLLREVFEVSTHRHRSPVGSLSCRTRPPAADLTQPPRSWAERTHNITRYTRMPRGGHFAAHEEPELLAHDLTEFFRPHR